MSSKIFDKLLEKATSPLLFEVDWDSILRMCDLIRQGDVQGKYAVNQLKKKLISDNVHVISFSLNCIESFVKNCGSKIHQEIANKEMMDLLRILATSKPDNIRNKILELIQCWAHAFKKNPNYKIVEDYFNAMKLEGFQFASLNETEAMFNVEEAPIWKEDADSSNCFRCRTQFTTFNRKHHCRACGEIFCNDCSSKTSPIPKFGIEKEVRVCDVCFEKIKGLISGTGTPSAAAAAPKFPTDTDDGLPIEYVNSQLFKEAKSATSQKPQEKSEQEFQEELQLALALSQSEFEEKSKSKKSSSSNKYFTKMASSSSMKKQESNNKPLSLDKFENERSLPTSFPKLNQSPSAPSVEQSATSGTGAENFKESTSRIESTSNEFYTNKQELNINNEIDQFVEDVRKILELYINRMKSDSMRGRSITNDTAVQSLFLQLQQLHPRLLKFIKFQEDVRAYYENLQDKLTQLKDAREALNALRYENMEKKRMEADEKERIRQLQIAQKLQHMRQQKQSYYHFQNQLNLQRLQEQENEIKNRLEQQRMLTIRRDQQLLSLPPTLAAYPQRMPQIENLSLNNYNNATINTMNNVQPAQLHHQMIYQQQMVANQNQTIINTPSANTLNIIDENNPAIYSQQQLFSQQQQQQYVEPVELNNHQNSRATISTLAGDDQLISFD